MSAETVPPRPPVGVGRQEPLHPFGQVRLGRLEYQVKVVRHQDKRIDMPTVAHRRPTEVILMIGDN